MRTFSLTLNGDGLHEPRRIEFDGEDPALALQILEREKIGRVAILWEGERRLRTLRRAEDGFWELAS